jgi:hypothetical protein
LNHGEHAFRISENVVVPKSEHSITFIYQAAIADRVSGRLIVLPAVHLNNQSPFTTNEIADITKYRFLPDKLMPVDLPVANAIPENGLCVCLIDP